MNWFANAFGGGSGNSNAGNNQQQQQNNQQQQPGRVQNPGNQGTQQNQDANNQGKMPGSNQEPPNPLDVYQEMMDNAAKGQTDAPPSFAIDPEALNKVSSGLDFMAGVDPELMQKAQTGDTQAIMQLVNQSNRNLYKTMMQHLPALTDKFISQRSEFDSKSLAPKVKSELTQQAFTGKIKTDHPVVRQELKRIAESFQKAHPDASPDQIAQMSLKHMETINSALFGQQSSQGSTGSNPTSDDYDWGKWLGNEAQG